MVFVLFSCTTSQGEYEKCSYGSPDIDSCFEMLNNLVASGWQMHEVYLSVEANKQTKLPAEAFDGEVGSKPQARLQRTWETILKHPDYFQKVFAHKRMVKKIVDRALELCDRISQQGENTHRRIASLFERMDSIQARIEETKAIWKVK